MPSLRITIDTVIYESPDGGKTVYARKPGDTTRTLHSINELAAKEQRLASKLAKLKDAVYLDDPVINDLLNQVEVLLELKK